MARWLLMEAVLRMFALLLQSAIETICHGLQRVTGLLQRTVNRCFSFYSHGGTKFSITTSGRICLEQLVVAYQSSLAQGNIVANNIQVSGINTATLLSFSVDLADAEGLVFGCMLSVEQLTVDCDYKFCGRVATFSVVDYPGHVTIILKRVTLGIKLVGHLLKIGDKEYIRLDSLKLNPTFPHIQFVFSEPGSQRPDENAFRVTLSNLLWQRLYDVLFLYVEREIGKVVIDIINRFTLRIPFSEMFVFRR